MSDFSQLIVRMVQNNPGALTVVKGLMEVDPFKATNTLSKLDQLDIRGPFLWLAYKDVCYEDSEILMAKTEIDSIAAELERLPYGGYARPEDAT